tara:strand:+ start:57 stop:986 length:930 start_codon:yes stop_codon:yes gene_type:complete
MSVLRGFAQLTNSVSSAARDISTTVSTINAFTGGLGNSRLNKVANIADRISSGSNILSAASSLLNGGDPRELGSALRMFGNAQQGVGYNAAPGDRRVKQAVLSSNIANYEETDWRVGISVPADLKTGNVLAPLFLGSESVGRMIFPFNPTILLGHSANYSQIGPTHTNYPFNAYENSQVDNITITGEFYSENVDDAKYWVAVLHFLRTVTKMYYGDSNPQGNPPPVCRLSGYGPHVLNNIPVVVSNFTTDLPADVDYIQCVVDGKKNMVPVQCQFTVTVLPTYSRRAAARFNLQEFAKGSFVNGLEGFV